MPISIAYVDTSETCGLFYLLLFYLLRKNIFLPSCLTRKKLNLSRKRRWFCWWHTLSWLVNFLWYHYGLYFPAIAIWYSRLAVMPAKAPVASKDEVSVRQFSKFASDYKKLLFEIILRNPYLLILILKLKGLENLK